MEETIVVNMFETESELNRNLASFGDFCGMENIGLLRWKRRGTLRIKWGRKLGY
jgi:hypothetical protein